MLSQDLVDYIKQQFQVGISEGEIKNALIAAGWQEDNIKEAFSYLKQNQPLESQNKSKNKKRWPWYLLIMAIIIVVPILLLGASFLVLRNIRTDVAIVDDGDLQWKVITVAQENNAYFDLLKTLKIDEEGYKFKDYVAGKTWSQSVVNKKLEKNKVALNYFDAAAKKSAYQIPELADPPKISFAAMPAAPYKDYQAISRVEALKALSLFGQGKEKEAFEEAFKILSVAQKIHDSQCSLGQYLMALSMKDIALQTIQRLARLTTLSSADLINYISQLEKYKQSDEGLKTAFKGEYLILAASIDLMSAKSNNIKNQQEFNDLPAASKYLGINNFYFEPNNTKILHANRIRGLISGISDSQYGESGKISFPFLSEINKTKSIGNDLFSRSYKMYYTRNSIGKILYSLAIPSPSLSSAIGKKYNQIFQTEATQTTLAVKAYYLDVRAYPESLERLVPKYLSQLPVDPFSSDKKLIEYLKDKLILRSNVANLKTFDYIDFSVNFFN